MLILSNEFMNANNANSEILSKAVKEHWGNLLSIFLKWLVEKSKGKMKNQ